jgi:MFS family permease
MGRDRYALAFGSLLPLRARIGDLFGRKPTFLIGLFGFAVISAVGGLAQSFGWLVAARPPRARRTKGALITGRRSGGEVAVSLRLSGG